MWYLVTVFILTVNGIRSCVVTSPDQRVITGTDVYLACNFSRCPGALDIMSISLEWEFQSISSQPQIILYYIKNRTAAAAGVFFQGDIELRSFNILLPSVTPENNGTYLCRLRINGRFHKNQTDLIVQSAVSWRNSPGVTDLQPFPLWLLLLLSVTGIVLLFCTVVLGKKLNKSIQRGDDSKTKEEVKSSTGSEAMTISYKVGSSPMPVLLDEGSPPSSPDNFYVTMVGSSSMPVLLDEGSPSSSPENIYVTMHGFPLTPVSAGQNRRLPSDWQPENEEPMYTVPAATKMWKTQS